MSKTTEQFGVGDKVYVHPGIEACRGDNYIRATITGIDKHGYWLRAFVQDLPGIYMFNVWDEDLLLRTSKAHRKIL